MVQVEGSNFWMRLEKMRVGVTHAYQYYANGKPVGNRSDVTGFNPDSYPKADVPRGKLSEKHTITSKIYDGMKADFWYYASPGVDPSRARAFDGLAGRAGFDFRRSLGVCASSP